MPSRHAAYRYRYRSSHSCLAPGRTNLLRPVAIIPRHAFTPASLAFPRSTPPQAARRAAVLAARLAASGAGLVHGRRPLAAAGLGAGAARHSRHGDLQRGQHRRRGQCRRHAGACRRPLPAMLRQPDALSLACGRLARNRRVRHQLSCGAGMAGRLCAQPGAGRKARQGPACGLIPFKNAAKTGRMKCARHRFRALPAPTPPKDALI